MFYVFQQLFGHIARLVAIGVRLQEIWKEKQLENHKDDKQFDKDDGPKRLAQRHRAKSIVIQMEYFIEKVVFTHTNCCKNDVANIRFLFLSTKLLGYNLQKLFKNTFFFSFLMLLKCLKHKNFCYFNEIT
jgi:hypothetical protein